MGLEERKKLRGMVDRLRHERRRTRLDRMPDETAAEYIAHYEQYGIEHFTPQHCPERFRAEVLAHFRRAA